MKLYPIFTNYLSNVNVQVEGYNVENTENSNKALRSGVAEASVVKSDDGKVQIELKGLNTDNSDNDNLPDGYRFLGWYEIDSKDSTDVGQCVSKDTTYTLPDDVDLSKAHYYIARLEYEVKYYYQENNNNNNDSLFASIWHKYEDPFQNIDGPFIYNHEFVHWGINSSNNNCSLGINCSEIITDNNKKIVKPISVYAHMKEQNMSSSIDHQATIKTDFPGSGDVSVTYHSISDITFAVLKSGDLNLDNINYDYNFKFWTAEENSEKNYKVVIQQFVKDAFKKSIGEYTTAINFKGIAHMTANVHFNGIPNRNTLKVERRYEESVFDVLDNNEDYYNFENQKVENFYLEYLQSYVNNGEIDISSAASPTDVEMEKEGYLFLGWVDKNSITAAEFMNIYGVENENEIANSGYTAKDARKAIPYLLDDDAVVTKPMDLYPVYVKTAYTTTTNIKESGVDVNGNIGVPVDPKYDEKMITNNNGYTNITFTVDNNQTLVLENSTDDTKYQFKYLEYVNHSDEKVRIYPDSNFGDTNKTITIENLLLGPDYTFIAYYEPYVLTYHINNENGTDVNDYVIRNTGQKVGIQPEAKFTDNVLEDYVFYGWTTDQPTNQNYWYDDGNHETVTSDDIVSGSMELWAVYKKVNITVKSNIDSTISDDNEKSQLRGWKKNNNGYQLYAKPSIVIDGLTYSFVEWKKDDTSFAKDPNYSLTVDDLLKNETYTAIYEKSYKVQYHGINGNVLYTVYVPEETKRSFVITDDNEDMIIDTEVYPLIYQQLGDTDIFIQWQWLNGKEMKDWNTFYKDTIDQNMDLYPVVYQLSAKDSSDNGYDQMTFVPEYQNNSITSIKAYLPDSYHESQLTVNVSQIAYKVGDNTSGEMSTTGIKGIKVELMVANENMQINPDDQGTTGDSGTTNVTDPYVLYGRQLTNASGDAVFELNGKLTITKTMADGKQSEEIFIFKVKDNSTGKTIEIPIDMDNTSRQFVTVVLPCGEYTIEEDKTWAWRYTAIGLDSNGKINIIPYFNTENKEKTVEIENTKVTEKWFSDSTHRKNEYKDQGGNG